MTLLAIGFVVIAALAAVRVHGRTTLAEHRPPATLPTTVSVTAPTTSSASTPTRTSSASPVARTTPGTDRARPTPARTKAPAPRSCFGVAALVAPASQCPLEITGKLTPTAAKAPSDVSQAYRGDGKHHYCFSSAPAFTLIACSFGAPAATFRVALVGNSHAGQWLPPLQKIAATKSWHITTYLASQCADVGHEPGIPDVAGNAGLPCLGAQCHPTRCYRAL